MFQFLNTFFCSIVMSCLDNIVFLAAPNSVRSSGTSGPIWGNLDPGVSEYQIMDSSKPGPLASSEMRTHSQIVTTNKLFMT